jgi:hypothetical protein
MTCEEAEPVSTTGNIGDGDGAIMPFIKYQNRKEKLCLSSFDWA